MIDIEKAKKEFMNYMQNYDNNEKKIVWKISHTFRVMEYSKEIAESLNLSKEQIDIATLIGLLHDIARFDQMKIYKTFSDKESFDHGDVAIQILEKDNFIRKFIETDKYDNIIKTAIKNHNKFKIEENLNSEELLFSKIIRDADKLDIFYEAITIFWNDEEEINLIENSYISEPYYKSFEDKMVIKRNKEQTKLDSVIVIVAFIFDINFEYSFKNIKKNDFINKILNKFNFKDESVRNKIQNIKKIAEEYLINYKN